MKFFVNKKLIAIQSYAAFFTLYKNNNFLSFHISFDIFTLNHKNGLKKEVIQEGFLATFWCPER